MGKVQRGEVIRRGLGPADQLHLAVGVQEQLRRAQLAVVVIAHGKAVRARVVDGHQVADLDLGQRAVHGELVVVLAQGARDVVDVVAGRVLLAQDRDVVVRAVHGRAHEVGRAGVQAHVLLVRVLDVQHAGDEGAVGAGHVAAKLGLDGHVVEARGHEDLLVLRAHAAADGQDVRGLLLRAVGDAHAAGQVHKRDLHAQLPVQVRRQLEQLRGKARVVGVVRRVGGEERVQAEALCAVGAQDLHPFEDLRPGHTVLGVAGVAHDRVAQAELAAGVVAQADRLGDAAVVLQEVDVGKVVQVDERAQAAGVRELLGRRVVGGEHDVLAHDPEPLAEHELGQTRAVHAAALVVQQAENGRVRAGLDRVIFLIPRVPLEGALQALRRGDDARLVVDVEGRGMRLCDLLDLSFVIGKRLHR